MHIRDFSQINLERCQSKEGFGHDLHSWTLSDWVTAVVGELGEAKKKKKKLNRVRDGIPGNKESPEELKAELRRELADAYIYLDLLASAAGVYLEEAVLRTFDEKSQEIGYPYPIRQT